jgi:site-specific DNA-methyltransferase (adenine-specific)
MSLQPGVVRDAIVLYLRDQGADGAKVPDIHAAVEQSLKQTVAASSVRSYLNLNTPAKFERLRHGVYRLRNV